MRYVHAVLRLNAAVCQLTMYNWFAKSTRTVSEVGPVVVVNIATTRSEQPVTPSSSLISTTGASVPSNVPVNGGCRVIGGSRYRCEFTRHVRACGLILERDAMQ